MPRVRNGEIQGLYAPSGPPLRRREQRNNRQPSGKTAEIPRVVRQNMPDAVRLKHGREVEIEDVLVGGEAWEEG